MLFDKNALAGKRILITGGGTGLGKSMSEGLLSHGADVYISGRRDEVLQQAVADLEAFGPGRIHYRVNDIRDPDAIDEMVDSIWQEGPLTGLINNAGANFISPTKDISPRGFRAICSTIMDGSYYASTAIGKRWLAEGLPGSILSSLVTWVWTGSAYVVPATMAKTAVHAMTMSLAVEWGSAGIRVNALAPGFFQTEGALDKLDPTGKGVGATDASTVPMGRLGQMPELQNMVIFMMSDGCQYLTGQTIAVDGGHHLAGNNTFAGLSCMTDEDWKNTREAIQSSVKKEKEQRSV